ncbi:MAG: PLP-dependent transferase [Bacteroidetes bacterium]|nr:PLP-dependent transferase [Bacteroidota bacterium]
MDIRTLAVHAGTIQDETAGAVTNPIFLSTTFERSPEGQIRPKGFVYTRDTNPNRQALEKVIAAMEGGGEALAFSSGMAAVLTVFQTVLKPGDHVLISDDCYHGVVHLLTERYPQWQVSFSSADMTNINSLRNALRPETKLIMVETPSNPQLKITDLAAVAALAKERGITTACDNTWATPLITRPMDFGIDIVIHSTTKYFGGHSDVLGGAVVVRKENPILPELRDFQNVGGAVPSPFDCWLLTRSIATMPLRVMQQSTSAAIIAQALVGHKKIEKVFYPGLTDHINHEVAARQMKNSFGAMLSVLLHGGQKEALAFASRLKIFRHATSLGGVESLIEHRLTAEGNHPKSPDNLMRVSIGIEHPDDLLKDLLQALA